MNKQKLIVSVPEPDSYSDFKMNYLKSKIADKNTNLTNLSNTTGISYSTLQKYRMDPDKLTKCGIKNFNLLSKVLSPIEENNEMMQKLGFSKEEIENRGLIPDHIEKYIIDKANLELNESNTNQNIAAIMVNSLFSLMNTDEYVLNVILKNVIRNLNSFN